MIDEPLSIGVIENPRSRQKQQSFGLHDTSSRNNRQLTSSNRRSRDERSAERSPKQIPKSESNKFESEQQTSNVGQNVKQKGSSQRQPLDYLEESYQLPKTKQSQTQQAQIINSQIQANQQQRAVSPQQQQQRLSNNQIQITTPASVRNSEISPTKSTRVTGHYRHEEEEESKLQPTTYQGLTNASDIRMITQSNNMQSSFDQSPKRKQLLPTTKSPLHYANHYDQVYHQQRVAGKPLTHFRELEQRLKQSILQAGSNLKQIDYRLINQLQNEAARVIQNHYLNWKAHKRVTFGKATQLNRQITNLNPLTFSSTTGAHTTQTASANTFPYPRRSANMQTSLQNLYGSQQQMPNSQQFNVPSQFHKINNNNQATHQSAPNHFQTQTSLPYRQQQDSQMQTQQTRQYQQSQQTSTTHIMSPQTNYQQQHQQASSTGLYYPQQHQDPYNSNQQQQQQTQYSPNHQHQTMNNNNTYSMINQQTQSCYPGNNVCPCQQCLTCTQFDTEKFKRLCQATMAWQQFMLNAAIKEASQTVQHHQGRCCVHQQQMTTGDRRQEEGNTTSQGNQQQRSNEQQQQK